jgi:hypothetical protein
MAASARVNHILSLAAELSREERAQVAAELLSAVESGETVDAEAWEQAWRDEIGRRSADPTPSVSLAEVRQHVSEALKSARTKREPP